MSYQGFTVPWPIGQGGVHGSLNMTQLGPTHLRDCNNLDIDRGLLRKIGGEYVIGNTGSRITSGRFFRPSLTDQITLVATADGRIIRDTGNGAFSDVLVTGLSGSREPGTAFTIAIDDQRRNVILATNRKDPIQAFLLDGTSISNYPGLQVADWQPIGPSFVIKHGTRMWAGGNSSDPHRMYFGTVTNLIDFEGLGSGTLEVFPNIGDRIVGGVSFKGMLLVWKDPVGVFAINTLSDDITEWTVSPISEAVGAVSSHAIIKIPNDVLFADRSGHIHSLAATDLFGDVETSNITRQSQIDELLRSNVSYHNARRIQGIWYPMRNQAWWLFPNRPAANDMMMLVADLHMGTQQARFLPTKRATATAIWTGDDNARVARPYLGFAGGDVRRGDSPARNRAGNAYPTTLETADTDFGWADGSLAYKAKNGAFLELHGENVGSWNVSVGVIWDDVLTETLQFSMNINGGEVLDIFQLDTDALAGQTSFKQRQRMTGQGRELRLTLSAPGVDQDFKLSHAAVSFTVADERIRHDKP